MSVSCYSCGHRKLINYGAELGNKRYNCRHGLYADKDWLYVREPRECSQFESLAEVVVQQKILRKSW